MTQGVGKGQSRPKRPAISSRQKYALALIDITIALKKKQQEKEEGNPLYNLPIAEFIPALTPKYGTPHHLKPVTDKIDLLEDEPQFIIYMVPPRHGKTETVLHAIARFIARNPDKTVAYVSYAQGFVNSQARKVHRMLKRLGVIPGDIQTVAEWRTSQGGGLLATGIGGPLTGQGVHLLVIDDALKNRQDADSPTIRNRQWEWFEDVAETRLEPGASVIILMTRWHEDDIVGRVMASRDQYTAIRLPALADGLDAMGRNPMPDPLGRSIGQPLWPRQDPKTGAWAADITALEKIRDVKPATFGALYQGLPRNKNEKLFPDAVYFSELPPGLRYSVGIDLAYSAKARANYSAIVVIGWAFTPGLDAETGRPVMVPTGYIVYAERWRAEIGQTRIKLARLQTRFPQSFGAEYNGPQKGVVDLLRGGDATGANRLRLTPLLPLQDKFGRAQETSEMWKAGRLLLPMPQPQPGDSETFRPPHGLNTSWVEAFLEEAHNFTGISDPEDDQIDAAVWAVETRPAAPLIEQSEQSRREAFSNPRRF